MPIGEVAGELLSGLFRILGNMFVEITLEVLLKGLGYLICRPFAKQINPDGLVVLLVGVVAWILIVYGLYFGAEYVAHQLDIDSCLDRGGKFNYENDSCEHANA